MENNLTNKEFKMLQDWYLKFEPYQYFQVYLQAHKICSESDKVKFQALFSSPKEYTTQKAFIETGEVAFNVPELRIINIDEDLLPIIEDTKPDYSDLKMKYPVMFINQQIKIGNGVINGFLLVDYAQIERDHPEIQWERDDDTSIRILAIGMDLEHEFEFYSVNPVREDVIKKVKIYIDDKKENKAMRHLSLKARELACNLLNLLVNDNKDIQEVEIKISDEQHRKRASRGKMPMRDTITLRVGGELKKYATEYSSLREHIHIRYHVGGFWRRFNSERYVNVKGSKRWIFPHYRNINAPSSHISKFVNVVKGG
jgi:hypothetical protein